MNFAICGLGFAYPSAVSYIIHDFFGGVHIAQSLIFLYSASFFFFIYLLFSFEFFIVAIVLKRFSVNSGLSILIVYTLSYIFLKQILSN